MPGGRPTKYKPEYCEMLIEHMAQGFSYESFAAVVDASKQTIYDWEKHPEFLDAKKRAFSKSRQFWEDIGRRQAIGDKSVKGGSTSAWIFNMKNRFNWTDRVETRNEHSVREWKLNYDESDTDSED